MPGGQALDQLGNWCSLDHNGRTQEREHNDANEVTEVNGSSDYAGHDAAGNVTSIPRIIDDHAVGHRVGVYDAWNRLVKLENNNDVALATYEYDGLGRRIVQPGKSGTLSARFDEWVNEDKLPLTARHRLHGRRHDRSPQSGLEGVDANDQPKASTADSALFRGRFGHGSVGLGSPAFGMVWLDVAPANADASVTGAGQPGRPGTRSAIDVTTVIVRPGDPLTAIAH